MTEEDAVKNNSEINREEVDKILADKELMDKILAEQGIQIGGDDDNRAQKRMNKQAVSVVITIISMIVIGLFILSPFIQFVERSIIYGADPDWVIGVDPSVDNKRVLKIYQYMVAHIHVIAHLLSAILYVVCVIRIVQGWKEIRKRLPMYLNRLLPLFLFLLFDLSIVLVTMIRGANEYDYTGHPYTYESIYFYILYPIAYFFCGMLISKDFLRKIILNVFLVSASILNLLEVIDLWIAEIKVFQGTEAVNVFHNRNHYGYYLAIVVTVSAMAFIYAEKVFPKVFYMISFGLSSIVLVVNDTLGAYLAVGFALFLFLLYTFISQGKNRKEKGFKGFLHRFRGYWAAIAEPGSWQNVLYVLVIYVLITFVLSFYYKSVMTSFFKMFQDVGNIIVDSEQADAAGSLRWGLWRNTFEHIWEHPFVGFGVEGMLNRYELGTPHNEFLQYASFFGLPTLILYVAATGLVIWRAFKIRAVASKSTMICLVTSVAYLTSSFFGVAIYYTTPFFFCILGMTYAEYFAGGNERVRLKKAEEMPVEK